MPGSNTLKKQLELVRFEKTIEYVHSHEHGQKHLNSHELGVLNNMLTNETRDPWRVESVEIHLPFGRKETMAVVNNPIVKGRDIINEARDMSQTSIPEAAAHLYSELVLNHLFHDANRRTAVAAVAWFLLEKGIRIPAMGLLELGVGDLRSKEQLETLKGLIDTTIRISHSRK